MTRTRLGMMLVIALGGFLAVLEHEARRTGRISATTPRGQLWFLRIASWLVGIGLISIIVGFMKGG